MKYIVHKVLEEGIHQITISRPKALNALSQELLKEFDETLKKLSEDKSCRVLLLRGEGDKSFVAGADIKEFCDMNPDQAYDLSREGQAILARLEQASWPTIALVNGYALGGGLELALACDIRIASSNAVVGLPEVGLGLLPGYGGTQRLAQVIGGGRAAEWIFSAGKFDAQEAYRVGLVNRVVELEELDAIGLKLAKKIARQAPLGVAGAKRALYHGLNHGIDQGYEAEAKEFAKIYHSQDLKEGVEAFIAKRAPEFKGE